MAKNDRDITSIFVKLRVINDYLVNQSKSSKNAIPKIIEILEMQQMEIEKRYKENNGFYLTLSLRETMKIARELDDKNFDELNKKLEENGLEKIDKWDKNH